MQTMNRHVILSVAPAVEDLSIHATSVGVLGLLNRKGDAEFEGYKRELAERLLEKYTEDFIKDDPILEGFRELRRRIGRSVRRYPSSTEGLIGLLRRTGKLPSINLAVDIYNVVSLETRLTLGAHDAEKLEGNIRLKIAKGTEPFLPLGKQKAQRVVEGDYCYVDDTDEVLCRLDYKQTDKTKITLETRHAFFIIQGNPATSREQVAAASDRLVSLIRKFCVGEATEIYTTV